MRLGLQRLGHAQELLECRRPRRLTRDLRVESRRRQALDVRQRLANSRPVAREALRLLVERGVDDRREVVGPELVEDLIGDARRRRRRPVVAPRHPVNHDDDQTPRKYAIGRDVRRHFAHPRRRRDDTIRNVDRQERHDRLRLPVLEHGEIRRRQPPHRPAILVEHGDVELDDVDACPEGGRLNRRRRLRARKHRDACRQAQGVRQVLSRHTALGMSLRATAVVDAFPRGRRKAR